MITRFYIVHPSVRNKNVLIMFIKVFFGRHDFKCLMSSIRFIV